MPDFAAVAASLGVTEAALLDALGTIMPPNFEEPAATLGISREDLVRAMPPPLLWGAKCMQKITYSLIGTAGGVGLTVAVNARFNSV